MVGRAMQEAAFLILTALAAGSRHGYGILSDVADVSDGRVRLRAGTQVEVLGVLMAGAREGQRRPGPMECLDLVGGAVRMHPRPRVPRSDRTGLAAVRLTDAEWQTIVSGQLEPKALAAAVAVGCWPWVARAFGRGRWRVTAAMSDRERLVLATR